MEEAIIRGIAHDTSEAKVTVHGVPDRPGVAAALFEPLAEAGVNVDMIVQNVSRQGVTDISFTVPRAGQERAQEIAGRVADGFGAGGVDVDPRTLLRGCGLKCWEFDHLVADDPTFARYHAVVEDSPWLDLADGFEAYRKRRLEMGGRELKDTERKRRKIERERSALELVPAATDPAVLRQLLDWKRAQVAARGLRNPVEETAWVPALFGKLLDDGRVNEIRHLPNAFPMEKPYRHC